MLISARVSSLLFLLLVLAVSSLFPGSRLQGQAKPAPPAIPPIYPTLTTPWNLGAKPGEKKEITITGTNLLDATGVWTSFAGEVTIPAGQKEAGKVKATISVPKETPLGLHFMRIATKKGISSVRPISVDSYPEVASDGKNKSKSTPQSLPVPVVVTGAATNEAAEYFKFPVVAGQPITLEVLGRRLGSPIDPVIILYDAKGKELGGFYADDTPGLMSDCRAVYTPKQTGEMLVEVRDTTYRGGADFTYRLRIGSYPSAMTAYPMNVERGKTANIGFSGPNPSPPVSLTAPKDPFKQVLNVSPQDAKNAFGWPVPVRISDFPELTEQEPNNELKSANLIPVPGGVSAQFQAKNDLDFFKIVAKKGVKYAIAVETYERNSPAEVYVKVQDAKGAELTRSNSQQALTRLDFTAPADGEFYIVCEHTNYLSGPTEVYHLTVTPVSPDFTLTFGLDRLDAPSGGYGLLPITVLNKLNGFSAPIEVTLQGEDVSGSFTIPANAAPLPATPLFIPFQIKAGAKPGPRLIQFKASAKVDGKEIVRLGSSFEAAKAALNGIAIPPDELTTQLALAITPEPPFSVSFTPEKLTVPQGGTLKGKFSIKRTGKSDEEITFTQVTAVPNITVKSPPIGKGKNDVEFEISAAAGAAPGRTLLIFKTSAKIAGQDYSLVLPPIPLQVTEVKKKEEPKKKDEPKKK
jgi:hypothetical protein